MAAMIRFALMPFSPLRLMRLIGLPALAAAAALYGATQYGEEIRAGAARVVDGDTLEIGGRRIRLLGVDAPELQQTCRRGTQDFQCGHDVQLFLTLEIGEREVTCRGNRSDTFGRLLARCTVAGRDVALWLVEQGFARAAREVSPYLAAEQAAQRARRGLWDSQWQPPWEFRARRG